MVKNIKLSIIMPLFNVEETVKIAIDSILMQKVTFDYEIIAVNDASTDNTLKILEDYAHRYNNFIIINHTKNQGNAVSFYDGLSASKGEYFSVLDGDDYYTIKDKLQRQVDFLDSDKEENYVAVAHKYLTVNKEGMILNDKQLFVDIPEHKYSDFLNYKFYYHTSTYMYRNIFRNCVPVSFMDEFSRGDNPRTFMHLMYTKGKIKVLNFIGSVYFYSEKGIWSQISPEQQKKRNISMLEYLQEKFQTKLERETYDKFIEILKKHIPSKLSFNNKMTKDEHLKMLKSLVMEYAYKENEFIFNSLYKSKFIDSYCESIGFIEAVEKRLFPLKPQKTKGNNILINISNLTSTGGGVYYEIKDIISLYPNDKVWLLLTDANGKEDIDEKVLKQLKEFPKLTILYGQSSSENKLDKLFKIISQIKPAKIYHYCGHDNVYGNSLIQSVLGKNICVFSYDHGFSLGLDNTSYDTYITKRPMDYQILSKHYKEKVIYIPCFNKDKAKDRKYLPFNNHSNLITACGAARYYKLEGRGYIDLIINLLNRTKGKHFHYGPIDNDTLNKIYKKLKENGISQNSFINIEWADDIVTSMYENNVDVFIEPFPVVSYKLTLDVLSAGIPVYVKESKIRLEMTDFIYDNALKWNNKCDFVENLATLSKKDLLKHSKLSRNYFLKNHSFDAVSQHFLEEKNFCIPKPVNFWDATLIDISNIEDILNLKENSDFRKNTFLENLFSIRNQGTRKIVTFLRFKFEIKKI